LWKPNNAAGALTPDDLRVTDSRYGVTLDLWRCARCEFVFAAGADSELLPRLYERMDDPGYLESAASRRLQMLWLLQNVLRVHSGARSLLDVGAGTGLLVQAAQQAGLTATGVEPSEAFVEHARRTAGVELLQGHFPHPALAGRTFDIVCLIDVIEHVTEPVPLLRACAAALNPDGILAVVTPDIGSIPARIMGARWWHFRLAHVGYFNKRSLDVAMAAAGLYAVDRFRAKWFFRVRYIAHRLRRYLPVDRLNRLARRKRILRRAYERVIPLNTRDSFALLLRRAETS